MNPAQIMPQDPRKNSEAMPANPALGIWPITHFFHQSGNNSETPLIVIKEDAVLHCSPHRRIAACTHTRSSSTPRFFPMQAETHCSRAH